METPEPICKQRQCRHFSGMIEFGMQQEPGFVQVPTCRAFPRGIPREIAYGKNLHLTPFKDDGGIQFEAQ